VSQGLEPGSTQRLTHEAGVAERRATLASLDAEPAAQLVATLDALAAVRAQLSVLRGEASDLLEVARGRACKLARRAAVLHCAVGNRATAHDVLCDILVTVPEQTDVLLQIAELDMQMGNARRAQQQVRALLMRLLASRVLTRSLGQLVLGCRESMSAVLAGSAVQQGPGALSLAKRCESRGSSATAGARAVCRWPDGRRHRPP
jgi:hypothetical protein